MRAAAVVTAITLAVGVGGVPRVVQATPEVGETEVAEAEATDTIAEEASAREWDPLEPMNRKIFWFNEQVDRWLIEPVATGWDWVMPDRVQTSIRRFFQNLRFPIVTVNDLLQGKVREAGVDVGRFAVNTTVGVAGFFDPATGWGLEENDEDLGQTFGKWGFGGGPYLVLPLLGPSNVRDGIGLAGDTALRIWPWFSPFLVNFGVGALDVTNRRSLVLEDVEQAREASLDFYVAVRNAYAQRRRALIRDSVDTETDDADDLYFFEEDLLE